MFPQDGHTTASGAGASQRFHATHVHARNSAKQEGNVKCLQSRSSEAEALFEELMRERNEYLARGQEDEKSREESLLDLFSE